MKKYVIILMIMAACLTSCHTSSQLSYFQDISENPEGTLPRSACSVKIEPMDELSVVVTSAVPEATREFNLPMTNTPYSSAASSASAQQQTYIVDEQGCIDFPVLGRITAKGMTITELKTMLADSIARYVADPQVRVELLNFKVNVMGEVKNPQTIDVKSERFSLLDALAAAGDLTEYGRREDILIIRETPDGLAYAHLNLRDASLTASPYFYLKQNDVVIVSPNSIRENNARYNTNNSYKISVISTVVSMVSVIASLIIALSVK